MFLVLLIPVLNHFLTEKNIKYYFLTKPKKVITPILISALRKQRQVNLHELEATLVYKGWSSRSARHAVQKKSISQNNNHKIKAKIINKNLVNYTEKVLMCK